MIFLHDVKIRNRGTNVQECTPLCALASLREKKISLPTSNHVLLTKRTILVINITSNGGAYLVLHQKDLKHWPGATDMKVYDSIPFGADEGLLATVNGLPAIVLGMPDPLYSMALPDGALLITAVSYDNGDELPELLKSIPEDWTSLGVYDVQDALVAFDAAHSGKEAASKGHELELTPGTYELFSQTWSGDTYELQLLRFRRKTAAKGAAKKSKEASKTKAASTSIPEKTQQNALRNVHATIAPLPDIRREQNGNATVFYIGEILYAVVELVDERIYIQLRKPAQLNEDLTALLKFYKQEHKDGHEWLLFSTPADNKPGPALEASLGRFAGTALRQLREQLGIGL